jgi:hypothetical protein
MLTAEQSKAHKRYENADSIIQEAVNKAYYAARQSLIDSGMDVANDDRAEALVAAILIYIEESA